MRRAGRRESRTEEALAERAKKGEARQLLMDVILPVLADPSVPDELVGVRLRNEKTLVLGLYRLLGPQGTQRLFFSQRRR